MQMAEMIGVAPVRDKLRALGIVALNGMFDENDAESVLSTASSELLESELAVVSSFGADSVVLLHLVAQVNKDLPVYFLETGKHFSETLDYVETLKRDLGLTNIKTLRPSQADLARFDPNGDLWETDPDSCCHIRKTEPLNEALKQYGGWVTGRKRFQTSDRGVLPHFELTSDDRIKINPLAYWDETDIAAYKAEHNLPEHPLFDKGYKSIGCEPCTSAVAEGEDPRSGRWRGLNKAECGIHFDFNGRIANPVSSKSLTLFRDGKFIDDPWHEWSEETAPSAARYVHVPFAEFVTNRDAYLASPHPLGLLIAPGDAVEDVSGDLKRFASIAIKFPAFTDGRGYSSARLIVERYGYGKEVRAVGDVLADQVPLMRRCGVNALMVTDEATRKALEDGTLAEIGIYYQPMGGGEVPAGTRPFLRRAAKSE